MSRPIRRAPGEAEPPIVDVFLSMLECARAWEPEACLMGNVRAGDIERAIESLRIHLPPVDTVETKLRALLAEHEGCTKRDCDLGGTIDRLREMVDG